MSLFLYSAVLLSFVSLRADHPGRCSRFYEYDLNFHVVSVLKVPHPCLVAVLHDWILTDKYYILPISPFGMLKGVGSMGMLWGEPPMECIDYDSSKMTQIMVIPRPGIESLLKGPKIFQCHPYIFLHHINGWDVNGESIVFDSLPFDQWQYKHKTNIFRLEDHDVYASNRVVRFSIDISEPAGTMMKEEALLTTNTIEFPTFNRDYFARPYTYIYASNMKYHLEEGNLEPDERPYSGIVKFNIVTKELTRYIAPKLAFFSEPMFAADPRRQGEEDGGWVISAAFEPNDEPSATARYKILFISYFIAFSLLRTCQILMFFLDNILVMESAFWPFLTLQISQRVPCVAYGSNTTCLLIFTAVTCPLKGTKKPPNSCVVNPRRVCRVHLKMTRALYAYWHH